MNVNSRKTTRWMAATAVIAMLGLSAHVLATSTIRNAWVTRYATPPAGTSASYTNMLNNCNLCHAIGGGANYNTYGWSIRQQIQAGATTVQALTNVEHLNADGMAGDNLTEIRASTQPGWTLGAVNTIYTDNNGTTSTNQPPAALISSTPRYDNCVADVNGSLSVDVSDLLAVINGWGACPAPCPPRCAPDVAPAASGDCQVNVSDLLAVINAWGSCP